MPVTLTPVTTIFGQRDSGLDQLTRVFKTDSTVEDARAAAPARFTSPDAIFAAMFLTEVHPRESGPTATEIEYVYAGALDSAVYTPRRKHGITQGTASAANTTIGQITIIYLAPHTTTSWIATDDSIAYSGYSGPVAHPVIIERRVNGFFIPSVPISDYVRNSVAYGLISDADRTRVDDWLTANAAALDAIRTIIIDFITTVFDEIEQITNFEADEILPGQYFACRCTSAHIFESPTPT
jgi:hypothetical protein